MNRNWGLLFLSAEKLYYSEYIVITRYNATGNGKRDMHSERIPVMVKKVKNVSYTNVISHKAISLSECLVEETKPPISNGYPKSELFTDMDVFTDCKRF